MKSTTLQKSITLLACALLFCGLSALANAGPKADITRLEQDFNAAYAANDLDKYFGYYSEDASDMQIRFSPQHDAAIASYLLHLTTRKADQSVADEVFQETDVWFKPAAGWKIAHVHYSDTPASAHK
jgi:ketosteroid isomerase-like protein